LLDYAKSVLASGTDQQNVQKTLFQTQTHFFRFCDQFEKVNFYCWETVCCVKRPAKHLQSRKDFNTNSSSPNICCFSDVSIL